MNIKINTKLTQKEILLKYLESVDDWIPEYKLRSMDTPFGWLGFSADRRCRELAHDNLIERRKTGKYAEFRFKKYNIPSLPLKPLETQNLKPSATQIQMSIPIKTTYKPL